MFSEKMGNALQTNLGADVLRPVCDPAELGFKLSTELETVGELTGQNRALDAIAFGTEIQHEGYNLFVLAPEVSAGRTAIMDLISRAPSKKAPPDDWVYVHNFQTAWNPQAMRLPSGRAKKFSAALTDMVDDLRSAIPALFESQEYKEHRKRIDDEHDAQEEGSFENLRRKAESQNIAILRSPMGFMLAYLDKGKVIKPEAFNALPEKEREVIQKRIEALQQELADVLSHLPDLEKQRRDKIRALNAELAKTLVSGSIAAVAKEFGDIPVAKARLEAIGQDLVKNIELFVFDTSEGDASPFPEAVAPIETDVRFRRYLVNEMVADGDDNETTKFPLIYEDHPSLTRLVGHIEFVSQMGTLVTDFSMIRPGALHRANGGYLVLDAHKLLIEPWAWDALKRALRSRSVTITSATDEIGLPRSNVLDPQPIDLDIKVILIGERILYYLLSEYDPDFSELFKVQVDFENEFDRSSSNIPLYARLIATIARRENLKPLDASAVAAIIDESSRIAEDSERLTLQLGQVSDLMREADHWAKIAERDCINAVDVAKGIEEQLHRASRIQEKSREAMERNIILIDTAGEKIGQVNGLSVVQLGKFLFGHPSRITARVRMGAGKIIDIERESKLGGPIHSKGVLILSSYLAANYASSAPMSLWASLVFEQSYAGVEGDSASCAELYALLSALAEQPISQSIAVTGSVNQLGEVQAIGGVNEKIEGFFDLCETRGLSGRQGVIIPKSNVPHLVLRPRVVEAVRAGKFHIHAVETIAEGIELLTGIPAGDRAADGQYPEGSINAKVEARLQQFADIRRTYLLKSSEPDEEKNASENMDLPDHRRAARSKLLEKRPK